MARTLISFAVLTAATPFGRALADEAGCLVIGAWDEARGEPAPVIEAVVSTIVNRARARGISVCDAVMDPAALTGVTPAMHELFAEAAKPHDGSTPQLHNAQDRAQLAIVLATAERAVAGKLPDPTYGATHFYSPSGMRELGLPSEPDWAAAMIKTATVGPFVFLREKGQMVAAGQQPIVPVAAPAAHLSRNDPIFALAPPAPAPPVVIEAVPFAAPSEPTLHSEAVAALAPAPSMMMLPIDPVPTPAPIPTPTVVPITTASVPSPIRAAAATEDWVAPASPFDPGAPRQVIRASGPRPAAPVPPVAPMTLAQAARPIPEARPVLAAIRPVTEARPMAETRTAPKPVKPVAVAALDRTPLHPAPFSPPHVGKTFEVAAVVVDPPHYLALPGTRAIDGQVAAAEAPQQSAPQYPTAQESTDDYAQQRGWDTRQAAPPGYETALRAAPKMEAPPTPLFDPAGNNPRDEDETTDTDSQDDTTQAAPQPAYAPPQYAQRQYAQPTYAQPTYAQPPSAQPTYAPPQYAAPRYSTPVYRAPSYAPPGYGAPQWNYYWNQAPAYSAPRANPPAGYWPYGPAAWKGCPAEDRKFVLVAAGNGWNQSRFVRRKVCDG